MTVVNLTEAEPELVQILQAQLNNVVKIGPREAEKLRNRLAIYTTVSNGSHLIFIDRPGEVMTVEQNTNLLVYVVARLDIAVALRR